MLAQLVERMDPRKDVAERLLAEVGISSLEDVSFSQTEESFTLKFGNTKFDLRKEDLVKPEIRNNLKRIGIDLLMNKEGDLKIKYNGEEIKETVE